MGTNYYVRHKVSQEKISELQKLLDQQDWLELRDCASDLSDDTETHIGKMSCGWRFSFQYFPLFGPERDVTSKSVFEFIEERLRLGDRFVDEYGTDIDLEEFKKEVWKHQKDAEHAVGWHCFKSKDGYDFIRGDYS